MDLSKLFACFAVIYQYTGTPDFTCDFGVQITSVHTGLIHDNIHHVRPSVPKFPLLIYGKNYTVSPICMQIFEAWSTLPWDQIVDEHNIIKYSGLLPFCKVRPVAVIDGYIDSCNNSEVVSTVSKPVPMVYDAVFNTSAGRTTCVPSSNMDISALNPSVRCYICDNVYDNIRVHVVKDNTIGWLFNSMRHFIINSSETVMRTIISTISSIVFEYLLGGLHYLTFIAEPVFDVIVYTGLIELCAVIALTYYSRIELMYSIVIVVLAILLYTQTKQDQYYR